MCISCVQHLLNGNSYCVVTQSTALLSHIAMWMFDPITMFRIFKIRGFNGHRFEHNLWDWILDWLNKEIVFHQGDTINYVTICLKSLLFFFVCRTLYWNLIHIYMNEKGLHFIVGTFDFVKLEMCSSFLSQVSHFMTVVCLW